VTCKREAVERDVRREWGRVAVHVERIRGRLLTRRSIVCEAWASTWIVRDGARIKADRWEDVCVCVVGSSDARLKWRREQNEGSKGGRLGLGA
jgi:hypothetical protein